MTAPASCPKLRIPWPDARDQDGQINVEKMQENWKSLERWGSGILDCMPSGGDAFPQWGNYWLPNSTMVVTSDGHQYDYMAMIASNTLLDYTPGFATYFDLGTSTCIKECVINVYAVAGFNNYEDYEIGMQLEIDGNTQHDEDRTVILPPGGLIDFLDIQHLNCYLHMQPIDVGAHVNMWLAALPGSMALGNITVKTNWTHLAIEVVAETMLEHSSGA